ncbi:MAG: murein L,D-transpeptidase catalytic domain-containing protein [Gemmatimonadota bacterium]
MLPILMLVVLSTGSAAGPDEDVAIALSSLSSYVVKQSHPEGLRTAIQAYYNFRDENPDEVKKPYLYYVDYGLDNRTARGYVFDMAQLKLVDGPFLVAHGRGSSTGANGIPTRFTNTPGSATTSLGLYVAGETYGFSGKSGGRYYTSIGLRIDGVSGGFNSKARERGVVVHGAPYVTPSRAGRSEGCPAMEQARARKLIPMIANGGMVFLFAPQDRWMQKDPWINGASNN